MNSSIHRAARFAIAGALALGAGASWAQNSLPDLRVNVDVMPNGERRSGVLNASCSERDALARVRIAIENIGGGVARTSTIVGGIRDVVTVEAVDAPFTREESFMGLRNNSANNIDPYEIAIFEFDIGKNMLKAGRIGDLVPGAQPPANWNDQRNLQVNTRRAIQRALTGLGFNTNGTNGSFGNGTRSAIEAFQRSTGDGADGVLTSEQMIKLKQRSREAELPNGYGQRHEFEILVIVDPGNRIREGDERNNKWKSGPISMDCGRQAPQG